MVRCLRIRIAVNSIAAPRIDRRRSLPGAVATRKPDASRSRTHRYNQRAAHIPARGHFPLHAADRQPQE